MRYLDWSEMIQQYPKILIGSYSGKRSQPETDFLIAHFTHMAADLSGQGETSENMGLSAPI